MDIRGKQVSEQVRVKRQKVKVGRRSLQEGTMCMDGVKVGEIKAGGAEMPVTPKTLISYNFASIEELPSQKFRNNSQQQVTKTNNVQPYTLTLVSGLNIPLLTPSDVVPFRVPALSKREQPLTSPELSPTVPALRCQKRNSYTSRLLASPLHRKTLSAPQQDLNQSQMKDDKIEILDQDRSCFLTFE